MRLCKPHSRLLKRFSGLRIIVSSHGWHASSHAFSENETVGQPGPDRRPFFITTPIFYVNAGNIDFECEQKARWQISDSGKKYVQQKRF